MTDYQFYKRMGICPQCKKNKLWGNENLCPECKAYFANKATEYRAKDKERINRNKRNSYKSIAEFRREDNLCTKCGKPRTDKYKMCPSCRKKNTVMCREKRNSKEGIAEYRMKNGLCKFCDNKRKIGYKVCEKHYQMCIEKSRSEKCRKAREKSNFCF